METYHSDVIECFIWDLQETSQRCTNGTSRIRTTKMSWWRTTVTSLGVSFETCLRRRRDALIGRRCCVFLRRCHFPIRCHGDVPLRRLGDVPRRRRWVFHSRRTCDVAERRRYDVDTTSCCRVGSMSTYLVICDDKNQTYFLRNWYWVEQ